MSLDSFDRRRSTGRRSLQRGLLAFAISALVLASTPLAWGDNVTNDVTSGGSDTIAVTASTTVRYKVVGTGGDGQSGCNASDGSPATITIVHPAQVTVVPETLVFTACNATQPVVFSSTTVGNYAITVAVFDSGVGTYSASQAAFTLHVVDVTPPEATINAAPSNLSSSSTASFSFTGSDNVTSAADLTYECQLDDAGYTGCTSPITYTDLVEGAHTFQVRAIDALGNTNPSPATHTWTIDRPDPVIDVDDPTPVAGGPLTITGDGYAPGAEITITMESEPVLLATTTADSAGSFRVVVTIPADAPAGHHTIKASGIDVNGTMRVLSVPITLEEDRIEGSTTKGPLAATGAGAAIGWLVIVGLMGVVLGRAMVGVAK